jgi:ABC-type multidrug transport system ATPase subunit
MAGARARQARFPRAVRSPSILLSLGSLYSWRVDAEKSLPGASVPPLVVRCEGTDRSLPAGPSYLVGRDPDGDIVVADTRVSWQHAVLKVEAGRWVLADRGSTNGTYAGGRRVQRVEISGECLLRLGHPVDGPLLSCTAAVAGTPARPPTEIAVSPAAGGPAAGDPPPRPAGRPHLAPGTGSPAADGLPAGSVRDDPVAADGSGEGGLPAALAPRPAGGDGAAAPGGGALPGPAQPVPPVRAPSVVRPLPARTLRIGRAPGNDIVVPDLSVSRYHAELRMTGGAYQIVDLDSHNGTYVNGQRVNSAPLADGDLVGIGSSTFRLTGEELQEFIDTGDVSLVARDLTVRLPGGKVLLDRVSFALGERCLLGIIGPSGAGKSTLLGALTGMRPAGEGTVLYDNRDLYAHYAELRHRIGLVPQENILHTQLTARRALRYAAELRFPRDTSRDERNRRVDEVLAELALTAHAETRTDRLSGGQQKRVNVALELMTKPSLLFLDEPTSGLDPGLDKSVMEMMAGLAHDGRTVIVVTHSVANLDICDRLLVLVPGGRVAYFGPPADGLKHFGKPGWAEVFQAFDSEPDRDWAGEFRRSRWYAQYVAAAMDGHRPATPVRGASPAPQAPSAKNRLSQFSTLCRRYLAVISSDRVYLALLAGAPVVLGGVILVIPAKDGLAPGPVTPAHHVAAARAAPHASQGAGQAGAHATAGPAAHATAGPAAHATAGPAAHATAGPAAHASAGGLARAGHGAAHAAAVVSGTNSAAESLLLILIISACFAGAFNAVRELVKERAIYSRERAAGLSPISYLSSKLAVLGLISGAQATVMVLIGLIGRKLPHHGSVLTGLPLAELILAIGLLAIVSMALGLLISASVNTSEKTMPILMVLVVVEVILTGGVFAIAGKAGLEQISWLSPSRWGFAATASTSVLNKLVPPAPGSVADPLWHHTAHAWLLDMGMLCALGIAFAALAWWRLARQGPGRRLG